jgi:hypothetical protein
VTTTVTAPSPPPPVRRGQRALAGTAVVFLVVAGGAWWAGRSVRSPAQVAANASAPPLTRLTAKVERRVVAETLVLSGAVGIEHEVRIAIPDADVPHGVPLVTKVPVRPGGRVREGSLLLEVSGRPLLALQGATPAYRDLFVGDSGDDVEQLQAALRRLGLGSGRAGRFDLTTRRAVEALFERSGYEAPTASAESPDAAEGAAPPKPQPYLPRWAVAFVPRLPATVATADLAVGVAPAKAALTLATGPLVITAPLFGDESAPPKVGNRVTWTVEGTTTRGRGVVSALTTVAPRSEEPAEGAAALTQAVVVTPDRPLDAALLQAPAQVTVQLARTRGAVLAVPVAAITTASDGSARVRVAGAGGAVTVVPVRPGLSGGGYVEVEPLGGRLRDGDDVLVSGDG